VCCVPARFDYWIDLPASLAIATLVLTHILSALMALICFSFISLCFLRHFQNGARRALSWFVSAGFGLMLSAFYLVPAIGTLHLISPKYLATNFLPRTSFAFPTITRLVYGPGWFTYQWTVPTLSLVGVVAATLHMRRRKNGSDLIGGALLLMLAPSWASLFMASELSYPLWLMNTPLRMVQFPWRFIYITSATGLVANALAFLDLKCTSQLRLRSLSAALPLALSLLATGAAERENMFFRREAAAPVGGQDDTLSGSGRISHQFPGRALGRLSPGGRACDRVRWKEFDLPYD